MWPYDGMAYLEPKEFTKEDILRMATITSGYMQTGTQSLTREAPDGRHDITVDDSMKCYSEHISTRLHRSITQTSNPLWDYFYGTAQSTTVTSSLTADNALQALYGAVSGLGRGV